MELTLKQKTAFGIGAVGKDMVYALSASYVMYYYQDVLGLSASFVGLVLMAARFFDAFNDPFMGVLVAKTRTRWGRFRPWIFSGTLLNALVLYALFAAPVMDEAALMVYFSVVYILWGVTYTMMDIPYWSMIPAVTRTPKDRENLSMVGRTCAGVGSALIAMFTMLLVGALGGDSERAGFRWVALIVAVIFAVTELVCCISMKETTPSEMKTATVKEMFSALFRNDQAMVVVGSIVLINSALYLTSNFIIYFFKYDLGGAGWKATYTLFSTVGGAAQILGMMVLYPLLRKKFSSTQVFHLSLVLALCGYGTLLVFCLTGLSHSLALLCIPGVVVFACNGMLTVLTTLFLSNSVDYGQLKTGRRDAPVDSALQARVLEGAAPVTDRPADHIAPEMAKIEAEVVEQAKAKGVKLADNAIDDALIVALFPQIAWKFLENRNNPAAFEPAPTGNESAVENKPVSKATQTASGSAVYTVELEGKAFVVKVSEGGDISHVATTAPQAAPQAAPAQATGGTPVTAPMAGNIWKVVATEGQTVAAGDVLFILEAMKMETEVKAAQAGTVRGICVKAGDAVAVGDTVMTLA